MFGRPHDHSDWFSRVYMLRFTLTMGGFWKFDYNIVDAASLREKRIVLVLFSLLLSQKKRMKKTEEAKVKHENLISQSSDWTWMGCEEGGGVSRILNIFTYPSTLCVFVMLLSTGSLLCLTRA